MTPTEIVERQVEAYNAHDLSAFAATYSETVEIYRLPATEPSLRGKAQLVEFYGQERFNRPDLHAEVVSRLLMGNKVLDHERIRGLREGVVEAFAVYEVADGLIQRAWFFAPD